MFLYDIKGTRLINVENLILLLSRINVFLKCNPIKGKTAPIGYNGVAEQLLFFINILISTPTRLYL